MPEFSFFLLHYNVYLFYTGVYFFTVQKEVLTALKQALFAKLSQRVLGNLTEESGALPAEALASLIKLSANITDTRDIISSLPNALHKVDSFER